MNHSTPFGNLRVENDVTPKRRKAVLKALQWCRTLSQDSAWQFLYSEGEGSLIQLINNQKVELFPLKAAHLDLGMQTSFSNNHLPINLNDKNACVRSNRFTYPRPLHCDMIASMILLLGTENFDPTEVPISLYAILTPEQLENVPPRPVFPMLDMDGNLIEERPLQMGDQEAREFIEQQPNEHWLRHAKRLLSYQHPATLRWILFEFINAPEALYMEVRWAIEQLYSHPELFADFEQYLEHHNPSVRCWAVENINIDDSNRVLEHLLPMRYDENMKVVHQVLSRLRELSLSSNVIIEHISPLLGFKEQRNAAIVHLGQMDIPCGLKFELLGEFLSSPNPDTAVATVRALRNSGDEEIEKALISSLNTDQESVVKCLLQSIEHFGAWFETYVKSYIGQRRLHQSLLIALQKTSGFSRTPYIFELLQEPTTSSMIIRGIATLSRIGDDSSLRAIGQYLLTHKSRYVRRNAAEYFGETGLVAALPYLELAQEDQSHGVRQSALRSIVQINAANKIPW